MKSRSIAGYTLIEMMMVVIILGLLSSMIMPHVGTVLIKAQQAQAKGNLSVIRTAISIYYADNEGTYPLPDYPAGDTHYTVHGQSLAQALAAGYMSVFPVIKLRDPNPSYNGLGVSYDSQSEMFLKMSPPKACFIVENSSPVYLANLNIPLVYNNREGLIWINNGNYDTNTHYFYSW